MYETGGIPSKALTVVCCAASIVANGPIRNSNVGDVHQIEEEWF